MMQNRGKVTDMMVILGFIVPSLADEEKNLFKGDD